MGRILSGRPLAPPSPRRRCLRKPWDRSSDVGGGLLGLPAAAALVVALTRLPPRPPAATAQR
jgi:hypothetical protein